MYIAKILSAINRAKGWLDQVTPVSEKEISLYALSMILSNQIKDVEHNINYIIHQKVELPPPYKMILMSLPEFRTFIHTINFCNPETLYVEPSIIRDWSRILEGLTLSYARDRDVLTVAGILRCAIRLKIEDQWLDIGQNFLLDQQQPDGSFGFFKQELVDTEIRLRYMSETLWALVEIYRNKLARE
ncbi:hypothetical protein [Bacillus thuringiensis]|uniref:hypothetical protein n=1 Tax=Bacillus cereus group TaxID=86661 RepID=UPI00077E0F8C|nr:hypothetical protein [Bacillus thuringiensis]AMR06557.1 hypothetical protein AXW78_30025 [Bacillus thuringiensis]PNK26887.1 hypothetical protein CBR55_31695 [Bacillus thuringiensis]